MTGTTGTTGTAEAARFARREWRRRLVALRPALIAVGVVAVVALGVYAFYFSSWLAARSVSVSGETSLTAQQVVDAAHVDLGTPLARIDLSAIEANVGALPAVASVSVHRSWPHTVTIEVSERQPVAAVRRDGAWWVMDATGVVFRRTPERDASLPIVQASASVGDDALAEAAKVIQALPPSVLADVRRLTAQTRDSIELRLKNHRVVRWGSADETDRKVQVLAVLLDQVKASVYDVSVPEQPTTRH
jgi:cell division protein FtsQ